jgi:Lrp/AsnC family leucine-responsive transcriptional regulator
MDAIDDVDREILRILMESGRESWSRIGEAVGLTGPSVAGRVRRLEAKGIIRGYAAQTNAVRLGYPLTAFIGVEVDGPRGREALVEWASSAAQVQEFHVVAGDFDYLVKVRATGPRDLERFLREELRPLPSITGTATTIVLDTLKESSAIPLDSHED